MRRGVIWALCSVLLVVTTLMPVREARAQVIDCNYLCWTFPCFLVCLIDPREKPEPLGVTDPEPWMWNVGQR